MISRLKRQLSLVCTALTVLILTAVLAVLLLLMEDRLKMQTTQELDNLFSHIVLELNTTPILRDIRLAELETQYRCLIDIEIGSTPLLFRGSYWQGEERQTLLSDLKAAFSRVYSQPEAHLQTLTATASNGLLYRGGAVRIGQDSDERVIYLLTEQTETTSPAIWLQRAIFLAAWLVGGIALIAVGRFLAHRMVQPLEESRNRQTAFIAAASHELRSPLAVIQANSEPPLSDRAAEIIRAECSRLSRLVGDLLLLAGADAKTWDLHTRRLDADTLLIDLYDTFQPVSHQQGVTFSLVLPEKPLAPIDGDLERLRQILTILLDNALFYTGENGQITLRAFPKGGGLSIQVADNGPGIPDDQKAKVFDRFYRMDPARTDKAHMGLGLSIAQELTALHRGRLSLSDTPGGGCTFTLWLPAAGK